MSNNFALYTFTLTVLLSQEVHFRTQTQQKAINGSARLAACILQGCQAKSPFCSVQRCKQIVRGKLLHVTVSALSRVVCVDKDLQSDWLQHESKAFLGSWVVLSCCMLLHPANCCGNNAVQSALKAWLCCATE